MLSAVPGTSSTFEDLFKKKFYDIPNALYRGSLGFKTAAVGSEEQVFDNILAAKTVTEISRASKNQRVEVRVPLEPPNGTLRAQRTLPSSSPEKKRNRRRKLRRRKLKKRRKRSQEEGKGRADSREKKRKRRKKERLRRKLQLLPRKLREQQRRQMRKQRRLRSQRRQRK